MKGFIILVWLSLNLSHAQVARSPTRSPQASVGCPAKGKIIGNIELISTPRSLGQLITRSNLIVEGTVTSVLPSFHPDSNLETNIETDAIVAVVQTLRGSLLASSIVVGQAGGKTEACEEVIPSDPLVKPGERYIFFLQEDSRPNVTRLSGLQRYFVVGLWHGKAKITSGKVAFLPEAYAALHKYDSSDVADFITAIQQMINHLALPNVH